MLALDCWSEGSRIDEIIAVLILDFICKYCDYPELRFYRDKKCLLPEAFDSREFRGECTQFYVAR